MNYCKSVLYIHTVFKQIIKWISLMATGFLVLSVSVFVTGCVSVFSEMQSARLVGKDNLEITPSVSNITFSNDNESDDVQNQFGVQAAYGASESVDFRLRFERIQVKDSDFGANVLGFGPKIKLLEDRTALYLPFGFAFGEDIDESAKTWEFHPTLLFTFPVGNNFEFNPSTKALIHFDNFAERDILVALNFGAGISTDLSKWAVRPEIGFLFNPGEEGHYTHYSIGFSIYP